MTMDEVIKRINELAAKAKTEGLNEEELAERDKLRRIYIDSVKASLTGHLDNTYIVRPDGTTEYYDKHHLFTFGGEHLRYTAGESRVIVEWRGVRILLLVCYDLRFPVWARNRGDYDMILYVASWPVPRVSAWSSLLVARAIENQCYVAGVNRVGTDPACEYSGASVVLDPYGVAIAECERGVECAATAEVDLESLAEFRAKFPVLNDADNFCLE